MNDLRKETAGVQKSEFVEPFADIIKTFSRTVAAADIDLKASQDTLEAMSALLTRYSEHLCQILKTNGIEAVCGQTEGESLDTNSPCWQFFHTSPAWEIVGLLAVKEGSVGGTLAKLYDEGGAAVKSHKLFETVRLLQAFHSCATWRWKGSSKLFPFPTFEFESTVCMLFIGHSR